MRDRSSTWAGTFAMIGSIAFGCGGAPPEPARAPAHVAVASEGRDDPVAPAEVTPAPVVATLVLQNPAQLVQGLQAALTSSPELATLGLAPSAMFAMLLDPLGENVVDWQRPAYLSLLESESADVPIAFSVGLTQGYAVEELEQTLDALESDGPGSGLVHGFDCQRHATLEGRERLICAKGHDIDPPLRRALEVLAEGSVKADLRLEVPSRVVKRVLDDAQARSAARGGSDAGYGQQLAQQLFAALGGVALELSLENGELSFAFEAQVESSEAFFPTLMVGDAPTRVPPAFDNLPEGSSLAVSSAGVLPALMRRAAQPVWHDFQAYLGRRHAHAKAEAVVGELSQLLFIGGPLQLAAGPPGPKQLASLARGKDAKTRRLRLCGWWAVGVHEPLQSSARRVGALLALDQKQFPVAPDEPAKLIPEPEPTTATLREHTLPAKSGLPAGSLFLQQRELRNPDYVLQAGEEPAYETTTYIYLTGDERETWLVASEHRSLALERARELLRITPNHPAKASLGSIGRTPARVVAVAALPDAIRIFMPVETPADLEKAERTLARVESLGGEQRLAIRLSTSSAAGKRVARFESEVALTALAQAVRGLVSDLDDPLTLPDQ